MQIVIEGEAAAILERLVELGQFASPQEAVEDAVEDALRLSDGEQQRRTAWIRARIQEALDEGGEGTLEDLDRQLAESRRRYEKDYP